MSSTYTWAQVVTAITGVANRGAFSKTYTPTTSRQTQNGSAGYYSSITTVCNAVSLSGNAGTGQVLSGYTFYSNSLTRQTGTMANRGKLNWSGSNTTYSVPAGYYSGGTLDSRTSYNNGYNSGVKAGKTAGWSLKTITATASSSDVSFTIYMPGNMSGTSIQEGPYLQFNTGVTKVCAIRAYIAFNSDKRLTIRWDAGMSNRSVTIRGSSSSGSGYEQGPIGTSSSSTFWVNGTNARLPISHVNENYYRSASFTVQIWYV